MKLLQASVCTNHVLVIFLKGIKFMILMASIMISQAQTCKPSGKIKGNSCHDILCITRNEFDCNQEGRFYTTYSCSPPVSNYTKAVLTIRSFDKGSDGGLPSACDFQFHSNDTPMVALSTGWFNNGKRCHKYIDIQGNGKSVKAMVVDVCDSTMGCDAEHDFQPPCPNNIVDASRAVWKALDVPENNWGWMKITWSDASMPASGEDQFNAS